ncbi:hypothetical protein CRYUN_Cryun33cG0036700 [Craigia yunnanensis]
MEFEERFPEGIGKVVVQSGLQPPVCGLWTLTSIVHLQCCRWFYPIFLLMFFFKSFAIVLENVWLDEYPGVQDSWMDIISSQGTSLLSFYLSGSDVTDTGLGLLKECLSLQALTINHRENIAEIGLKHITGLMNFTSLSFKKSDAITAEGMRAFSSLVNLGKLDLERCSGIHGGFVHIKGLSKLESLNIRCCKCITDLDLKAISGNFDKFFGLI